jgi:hypothetical protein
MAKLEKTIEYYVCDGCDEPFDEKNVNDTIFNIGNCKGFNGDYCHECYIEVVRSMDNGTVFLTTIYDSDKEIK